MTTATPVRLPQGNSGREYLVTDVPDYDYLFPVVIEPMTGRRVLPSAVARLRRGDARALGVRLIELAGFAAIEEGDPRPPETFRAYGARGYRAVLRPADSGARRVRLVAVGRGDEILSSLSDAFTAADARALGVALIAAAGSGE